MTLVNTAMCCDSFDIKWHLLLSSWVHEWLNSFFSPIIQLFEDDPEFYTAQAFGQHRYMRCSVKCRIVEALGDLLELTACPNGLGLKIHLKDKK